MARRIEQVTELQWLLIERELPRLPRNRKGGRPWADSRRTFEGILWVLKSGARWKDLPDRYPSPATCWRRLKRWEEQGVWLKLWRAFLRELDAEGRLRWSECFIDGSFAPAKKGALGSARPSVERVRSGWWWSAARVFLSEVSLPRPHQLRSHSWKPRWLPSEFRDAGAAGRRRTRRGSSATKRTTATRTGGG